MAVPHPRRTGSCPAWRRSRTPAQTQPGSTTLTTTAMRLTSRRRSEPVCSACGIGENPEDGKAAYRGATSILDLALVSGAPHGRRAGVQTNARQAGLPEGRVVDVVLARAPRGPGERSALVRLLEARSSIWRLPAWNLVAFLRHVASPLRRRLDALLQDHRRRYPVPAARTLVAGPPACPPLDRGCSRSM